MKEMLRKCGDKVKKSRFSKHLINFMCILCSVFTEADAALLLLFASSSLQFDDSVNTLNSFQMEMKSSTRARTKTL